MALKPLRCATPSATVLYLCQSEVSRPAGLCWKGQQPETPPLLYPMALISDIETRCQRDYVVVCNKSSCYPCYSHVAVLVNQLTDYLSAVPFPYTPHFSASCTKLPKICQGKADSGTEEGDFPHPMGQEELCWKLNLYEYSSTALLPSLCRKRAGA